MIELMECPIAGFQFHGGEACWSQIRPSDRLVLRRQPGNRHDPRAITVEWQDVMLGYVPREANYALSQMMDRGARVEGRVKALRAGPDPWQRVMMEIVVAPVAAAPPPAAPPAQEIIVAPASVLRLPPLRLQGSAPAHTCIRILEQCVAEIARRLAMPVTGLRQGAKRELRLWDLLAIETTFHGRRLAARYLAKDAVSRQPDVTLDLKHPLGEERWVRAFGLLISNVCAREGLSAIETTPGISRWIRTSLELTFRGVVDFEALRKAALEFLAPDPLARSLANRIHGRSPWPNEFNWVCSRASALAVNAIEHPAMLPFLRVVQEELDMVNAADPLEGLRAHLVEQGMPPAAWKRLAVWGWETFESTHDRSSHIASIAGLLHSLEVQAPPPPAFVRLAVAANFHRDDTPIELAFDREPPWFHRALLREVERLGDDLDEESLRETVFAVVDWLLDATPEADSNQQKAGWRWIVEQAEAHRVARTLQLAEPWWVPVATVSWPGHDVVAIQSAAELVAEGEAMKNCLPDYEDACRAGEVAVFSIREPQSGKRVACFAARLMDHGRWDLMQVAGKMNQAVSPDVRLIANATVAKLNGRHA